MKLTHILKKILNESVDSKTLQNATEIVKRLKDAGYKNTFFVGGYVRDKLLGIGTAKDIDIATEAKPEEIEEVFKGEKFKEVGRQFNVPIVVIDGEQFEIASFRKDSKFSDGRRPDAVYHTRDPEVDAIRRDFTVNALFYDPIEDKIHDFVGGQKDIEKKILRAIGEPVTRYEEDYLRMLRAIRFAAVKGFTIEPETFEAIKKTSGDINKISKERIKAEMDKILMSDRPGDYIEIMRESGLLKELFPEVLDLHGVPQNPQWHPEGAYVKKL